jgi:hypothetical protein
MSAKDEDYSNEGRGKEAGVGKRLLSTAFKATGKGFFNPLHEANSYLDKKYRENVPESKTSEKVRSALFGKDPEMAEKVDKEVTKQLGAYSYAKGGSASARADGIAQRGKTKGTMIMCGGGYMKGKK